MVGDPASPGQWPATVENASGNYNIGYRGNAVTPHVATADS